VPRIGRDEGRLLFGADPAGYDLARPGHAERVYDVLVERCGLGPVTTVLEVGPGTGQATRRLLELGADPLVALEPNPELAAYLRKSLAERIVIRETALEDAELPAGAFDLAAAASSFHWVEEDVGLARILAALRPGGWFAMWWTLFGDRSKPEAFIAATTPLLENLDASPTRREEGRPSHGRDREARVAALDATGFVDVRHELAEWEASWDTAGIRALYGSFSPVLRLEDAKRTELLDEIARIADEDFGGRVSRAITTALYTARCPG
jgi:SAM-dependent methyltransferase